MTALAFPKPERRPPAPRRNGIARRPPAPEPPHVRAYLRWIRKLECRARLIPGHICDGRMTAHHAGRRRGVSLLSDYRTAIPLCWRAHLWGIEVLGDVFKDWTRDEIRAWEDDQISSVRELADPGDSYDHALELQHHGLILVQRDVATGRWWWVEAGPDAEAALAAGGGA